MKNLEIEDIFLDTIDSTNSYAKAHSKEFNPQKVTCITAEYQTAGKGQFERKWISPRSVNIYSTFYFHIPSSTKNINQLSQVMAFSLAAILKNKGLHPTIKWPNDVQIHQKKIAGVLAEVIFHPEFIEVILGIGINVNMQINDLALIDQPATSLKNETGLHWDKNQLLKELQYQFLLDLRRFIETNSEQLPEC